MPRKPLETLAREAAQHMADSGSPCSDQHNERAVQHVLDLAFEIIVRDAQKMTLDEIKKELKCSYKTIEKVEKKVLTKLKEIYGQD